MRKQEGGHDVTPRSGKYVRHLESLQYKALGPEYSLLCLSVVLVTKRLIMYFVSRKGWALLWSGNCWRKSGKQQEQACRECWGNGEQALKALARSDRRSSSKGCMKLSKAAG